MVRFRLGFLEYWGYWKLVKQIFTKTAGNFILVSTFTDVTSLCSVRAEHCIHLETLATAGTRPGLI